MIRNRTAREALLLTLLVFLLCAPALKRALYVDDQFFVQIASWIKDNPAKPYDFPNVDGSPASRLSGAERQARLVNPPLHHYILALLLKVGGGRLPVLRLGTIGISIGAALFLVGVMRRLSKDALWPTLLFVTSPAAVLTGPSLLIDTTLSFFVFGSLYFVMRAVEEKGVGWFVLSGVFLGLGLVSKYTASLGAVLILAWALLNGTKRDVAKTGLSLAIAALFLLSFLAATRHLYGVSHFGPAAGFSLRSFEMARLLVFFVFLGGVAWAPMAVLFIPKKVMLGAWALVIGLFLFLRSYAGGYSNGVSIAMAVLAVGALWPLCLFLFSLRKKMAAGDGPSPSAWFVGIWGLSFVAMMAIVMPWVAARYYLIGLPPFILMSVSLIERFVKRNRSLLLGGLVLMNAIVSWVVLRGDILQAEAGRFLATDWLEKNASPDSVLYFEAEGYAFSDLHLKGAQPLMSTSPLHPGDRIVATDISFPVGWLAHNVDPKRLVLELVVTPPFRWPVKVMDIKAGGAFYGSLWGPLPFVVSQNPVERFFIFRVNN